MDTDVTTTPIRAFDGIFTLPLIVVALFFDVFLLIDGNSIFGLAFTPYETVVGVYMAMDAVLLGSLRLSPGLTKLTFMSSMVFFVPAFIITTVALSLNYTHKAGAPITFTQYIVIIIMQVFVVSLSEELLFRGLAEKYFGWIGQGILFGLFHLTAYQSEGFVWYSIFIAMAFGIAMGYIVMIFTKYLDHRDWGLSITWGIHAGWNVAILLSSYVALGAVI